ncbi:MAG TPA: carbon monoxide dehydrogenase, partial [Gammaproteobacteria bacterium]|nr:carbon monoxide dehydrogenase [Gammaproteobacteria bacterium]
YEKFPIPASRSALVGVFVARFVDHVRVAVTGAAASAFRLVTFEKALAESFDPASLLGLDVDSARLLDDLHGGADYRAHLVGVLARRAVARCQNGGG